MIRLQAPAKLNFYLRVLGARPDGYHEIETVFARTDLADTLVLEPHPEALQLSCDVPELSCGEDNLILKAARLLRAAASTSRGARLRLTKRIPIAAGLGGGSSDAASALTGLNRLWELRLDRDALLGLGARLGSDVPFFLQDMPCALGLGRGERCEQLPVKQWVASVLVVPNVRLSTAEIYQQARFDLTAPKPSFNIVAHALRNGSLDELAKGLWNDLAPEAIRRCPLIADIQASLRELGCPGVCLSGSGPSVFGLCRGMPHAQEIATQLRRRSDRAWRVEVIRAAHA